jgi:MFS family permease
MVSKRIYAGILAIAATQSAIVVLGSSMGSIAAAFANTGANLALIQLIITTPSLFGIVANTVAGALSVRISKKKIAVIGVVCILFGGCGAYFIHSSIFQLMFFAAFIGIGAGFTTTMVPPMIADYYPKEKMGSMMGITTSANFTGAMVLTFLCGMLARNQQNWYFTYLSFLLMVPILAAALMMPARSPAEIEAQGRPPQDKPKAKLRSAIIPNLIIGFIYMCLSYVFMTNIALHITENGLGDSGMAGIANAMQFAGGIVSGIIFVSLAGVLKKYGLAFAFLINAIALLIISVTPNIVVVIIASIIPGVSIGMFFPTSFMSLASKVDGNSTGFAIGVFMTCVNMGGFISPAIITPATNSLGWVTAGQRIMFSGIAFAVVAVILAIGATFNKESRTVPSA